MNNNDVFVIHPYLKIRRMFKDSDLEEAYKLTEAIDLNPIFVKSVGLDKINSKTFLNSGFVKIISEKAKSLKTELVFVNCSLSPIQQRNLEKEIFCKVIDRTGLILEIFGARANSNEGKLQVNLASLIL